MRNVIFNRFCLLVIYNSINTSAFQLRPLNARKIELSRILATESIEGDPVLDLDRTKQLCKERNIPFEKVKNARDLASVPSTNIKPNKVFRMGMLSDATPHDIKLLEEMNMKTIVDLRSATEWKADPRLNKDDVYGSYATLIWKEGNNKVTERQSYEVSRRERMKKGMKSKKDSLKTNPQDQDNKQRKERHFVSIMDELKYVRGTLRKLRRRDILRAIMKSPGYFFSSRIKMSIRSIFLDEINGGGLPFLNELLMRMGESGIKYALDLVADPEQHPIAFYCTAGKDRTGIIAALILAITGTLDEDIVEDYSLSANVYAEINDHTAMVGALSQRGLDPETFFGAPPQVMRDTLANIKKDYGSVEGYLDWIGFGEDQREKLRDAIC